MEIFVDYLFACNPYNFTVPHCIIWNRTTKDWLGNLPKSIQHLYSSDCMSHQWIKKRNKKKIKLHPTRESINWTMNWAIRCSSLIQRQCQMSLLHNEEKTEKKRKSRHWNAYGLCIQLYTISCSELLALIIMIVCCNFRTHSMYMAYILCSFDFLVGKDKESFLLVQPLYEVYSNFFVPWQWHNWGSSKSAKQHKNTPIKCWKNFCLSLVDRPWYQVNDIEKKIVLFIITFFFFILYYIYCNNFAKRSKFKLLVCTCSQCKNTMLKLKRRRATKNCWTQIFMSVEYPI